MTTSIPHEPRVFLEIGAGPIPFPLKMEQGRLECPDLVMNPEDVYISVDRGQDIFESRPAIIHRAKTEMGRVRENLNNIFVDADATSLPMPNESVDCVFMGNVISAYQIHETKAVNLMSSEWRMNLQGHMPSRKLEPIHRGLIEEAWRVLKRGGKLIIEENSFPVDQDQFDKTMNAIRNDSRFSVSENGDILEAKKL